MSPGASPTGAALTTAVVTAALSACTAIGDDADPFIGDPATQARVDAVFAAAGPSTRSSSSSSERAKSSSFEMRPASTTARMARWAAYSVLWTPTLLWSRRHALRRSTQKRTSWREIFMATGLLPLAGSVRK